MDILRRNTDYALRMMAYLAVHFEQGPISTKDVSGDTDIPYYLSCKLMQKLQKADLIESSMGPKGGFKLSKTPSSISLLKIIETIQGTVSLNRCLVDVSACVRQRSCPVNKKLAGLQEYIATFLRDITLDQLLKSDDSQA